MVEPWPSIAPEPFNVICLMACLIIIWWMFRVLSQLRRLCILRAGMLESRVVRVRGIGVRLHIFDLVARSHFQSLVHTRQALRPLKVPTMQMPISLDHSTVRVSVSVSPSTKNQGLSGGPSQKLRVDVNVRFQFHNTLPCVFKLLWGLDKKALDDAGQWQQLIDEDTKVESDRRRGGEPVLSSDAELSCEVMSPCVLSDESGELQRRKKKKCKGDRGGGDDYFPLNGPAEEKRLMKMSLSDGGAPPPERKGSSLSHLIPSDRHTQSSEGGGGGGSSRRSGRSTDRSRPLSSLETRCGAATVPMHFASCAREIGLSLQDFSHSITAQEEDDPQEALGQSVAEATHIGQLIQAIVDDNPRTETSYADAEPYPLAILIRPVLSSDATADQPNSTRLSSIQSRFRSTALRSRLPSKSGTEKERSRRSSRSSSSRPSLSHEDDPTSDRQSPSVHAQVVLVNINFESFRAALTKACKGEADEEDDVEKGSSSSSTLRGGSGGGDGGGGSSGALASFTEEPVETQVLKTLTLTSQGQLLESKEVFGFPTKERDTEGKMDQSEECTICLTEPKDTTLLPCRHLCVCSTCFKQIDKCPVCRAPFETYIVFNDLSA